MFQKKDTYETLANGMALKKKKQRKNFFKIFQEKIWKDGQNPAEPCF